MPAEPVTVTERSLIPRELLTILAALCFVCTTASIIIAAIGWERGTLKNQLKIHHNRYTEDYSRFVLSIAPFIVFSMIFAGLWNAKRIALFALGLFVFWAGMAIDMSRETDNVRNKHVSGDGSYNGSRMLEAGLILSLFFTLLSLLSISPRDTTRWWHRGTTGVTTHQPQMHAVTAPGLATTTQVHHHGPRFILHYILTSLAWLVTLAGCATLFENIRRDFRDFPVGFEGAQVLQYMYFVLIVVAFFAVSTALLCDSDIYAGFSLALNTMTIIFGLRFAVDVNNYGFDHPRKDRIQAGLLLLGVGSFLSSCGIMSRRSNIHVDPAVTAPNPALP